MAKEFKTQVEKEHYESGYEDFERFISYHHQIELIESLKVKSLLELGPGTGFLSDFLKKKGIKVKTADFDKSLKPDIVCDIRDIPVKDNSYDAVCAFEVLEHLPYKEALKAVKELVRVSKKYVLVSVPYSCIYLSLNLFFGIPIYYKLIPIGIRIPFFWISGEAGNKQHYWELGRRGYWKSKFISDIKKESKVTVLKKGHIPLHTQHFFLLLEKN